MLPWRKLEDYTSFAQDDLKLGKSGVCRVAKKDPDQLKGRDESMSAQNPINLTSIAAAVAQELATGDSEFALRLAMKELRRLQQQGFDELAEPPTTGSAQFDALIAAGARVISRGKPNQPTWGMRLEGPWFPAEDFVVLTGAYRALTVKRTPTEFAAFNIFLKDDSLCFTYK